MKKALIFGITGQDGIFLSSYLIKKNYQVYGYYRNLNKKIKLFYSKSLNKKLIFNLLQKIIPDEIYYLIGESSSYYSFKNILKKIINKLL